MTPEQMAELLTAWAHNAYPYDRRVTCVEPEGERRTWVLTQGSRQVGHVRLREDWRAGWLSWTVEASDRTRAMLGL